MCKLCNSDSPPILSSKQPINHVVKDYIGTFPCKNCIRALYIMQQSNPDKSFDHIILTKLYYRYRGFNYSDLAKSADKANVMKCVLGIQPIYRRGSKQVVYKSCIARKNKSKLYLGIYPTLSEALEIKLKYMQEYGHTNGITQLTNKLKELSCN